MYNMIIITLNESFLWFFRAQFAVGDSEMNMLHGSDSTTQADAELAQLFKVEQTLAVIKPDAAAQRGMS